MVWHSYSLFLSEFEKVIQFNFNPGRNQSTTAYSLSSSKALLDCVGTRLTKLVNQHNDHGTKIGELLVGQQEHSDSLNYAYGKFADACEEMAGLETPMTDMKK